MNCLAHNIIQIGVPYESDWNFNQSKEEIYWR